MPRPLGALLLALLLPLAACGGDGTGPDEDGVSGTYTLRTVNGNGLPFTLGDNGVQKVEVTGGRITLSEDLTYSEIRGYRTTDNGLETTEDEEYEGTYTHVGTELLLTIEGVLYPLSLSGGTITEWVEGFTIVWTR